MARRWGKDNKKVGERQVNTLLYIMGERAEDIFQSFNLREEEIKNYKVVVERFQRHLVRDTDLSEKLQLDAQLDLQKAVNAVRQRETVKKQQATLQGMITPMEGTIDAVHKTKQSLTCQNAANRRESHDHSQGTPQHKCKSSTRSSTNKNSCTRCGKAPNHPRQQRSELPQLL